MAGDDAVDEENIILCCALCCVHLGLYRDSDCTGCSGKVGFCCLNFEVCCKPSAPCLPLGCIGPKFENDGCSIVNAQVQCCFCVFQTAIPCNEEVPMAINVLGLTVFPRVGCCKTMGAMDMVDRNA